MASTDIHRHRLGIFRALEAKVALVNAGLGHQLTKGEATESDIRDLLVSMLPHHFGVGTGIIIDIDGRESRQQDVVIFDRTRANYSLNETSRIFFVDQVIATLEIKTRFTRQTLREALANVESVKQLRPVPHHWIEQRHDEDGGVSMMRRESTVPFCSIFFFSADRSVGPVNLDSHNQAVMTETGSMSLGHQPDLLLSLAHSSIFRHLSTCQNESSARHFGVFVRNSDGAVSLPAQSSDTLVVDFDAGPPEVGDKIGSAVGSKGHSFGYRLTGHPSPNPLVHRVGITGEDGVLLDSPRSFLLFFELLEQLCRLRHLNPIWTPWDYLGVEHGEVDLFSGSQPPPTRQEDEP
jgi:hypothetical protein